VAKQTDHATWKALARLEERWVRTSDGDVEEVGDVDGGTEGDREGEGEKKKKKSTTASSTTRSTLIPPSTFLIPLTLDDSATLTRKSDRRCAGCSS